MNGLAVLIPIALMLGLAGLAAFFWAMRSGQFEDMEGAALRIFIDDPASPDAIPEAPRDKAQRLSAPPDIAPPAHAFPIGRARSSDGSFLHAGTAVTADIANVSTSPSSGG